MLPALFAIGAGMQIIGGFMGNNAARAESEAREAALRESARRARMEASDVQRIGAQQAGQARMQGTVTIGQARAAAGASGLDAGSESVAGLLADQRFMSELDVATIRNNAAREAYGLVLDAKQMEAGAAVEPGRRRNMNFATALNTFGSVAGTAVQGRAAGFW